MQKIIFFIAGLFASIFSTAQSKGILPLTGIKYFKEGITGNIDTRTDGASLLSNRVSLNKEISFLIKNPAGFAEKNKLFYPAAEVIILSAGGVVLSKEANVLKEGEKGFSVTSFKDVGLKLILTPAVLKNENTCIIKIRFYDLKSSNQLRLEFPASISSDLRLSKTVSQINVSGGSGYIQGVTLKKCNLATDTSIRVSPKMAYTSFVLEDINGSSMNEILGGKETFWVFDDNLNEVKMTDKLLKQVKGAMEDNSVEYTLKVPFRLKTNKDKYHVRFRWESRDMKKIIDLTTRI